MSLDNRYDAVLKDMINLLQQAICRFVTHQQVDISKFKYYFCNFNKNMQRLEEEFHPSKTKYSKQLRKIEELFIKPTTTRISLQPTPMKTLQPSQALTKPIITSLNSVQEEKQFNIPKGKKEKRNLVTENNQRRNLLMIDFEERPKTGVYRSKDRHRKTIDSEGKFGSMDCGRKERKEIYNDLQRQSFAEIKFEGKTKLSKKKTIPNTQRWAVKINKLF